MGEGAAAGEHLPKHDNCLAANPEDQEVGHPTFLLGLNWDVTALGKSVLVAGSSYADKAKRRKRGQ
jgi:hypothetical protein